ncbi:hypothetical protein BHM03_00044267 [Ensete ventricosum]|nr:hypothetical protein BHM03_00044267 [Ensete ventricosum]
MLSASRDGWPRPGHMQGGDLLWPRPPAKGWPIAARASPPGATPAHGQTAGAIARGWPVVAQCLQGMAAARGQATGTTAWLADGRPQEGSLCGRPLAGRLSAGKGSRRLYRGDDAAMVR